MERASGSRRSHYDLWVEYTLQKHPAKRDDLLPWVRLNRKEIMEWQHHILDGGPATPDDFIAKSFQVGVLPSLDPQTKVGFVSRLLSDIVQASSPLCDAELIDVINELFFGMQQPFELPDTPEAAHCYRSILPLFTEVLDKRCKSEIPRESGDTKITLPAVVFMIPDASHGAGFGTNIQHPEERPELAEAEFDVFTGILKHCSSAACLESALHGLGHAMRSKHLKEHHRNRIVKAINKFLHDRTVPDEIRYYAKSAKNGEVL
jgi:hypothetical protein